MKKTPKPIRCTRRPPIPVRAVDGKQTGHIDPDSYRFTPLPSTEKKDRK